MTPGLIASAALAAQIAAFSIAQTSVEPLPLARNGVAYELYAYVPSACEARDAACPIVYMLDAEYSFPLAAAIIDHLSARGRIKPVIAISIAYQDKSNYRLNRTRDYTPYHVADGGYGEEFQKASGGGAEFLKVIEKEIIPYAEERFGAGSGRVLVGHSYGGLFAAYAWAEKPELFDDYIIVSPSLWYDGGRIKRAAAHACEKNKRKSSSRLVLEVGEYEEQPENGRAMVSDLAEFNKIVETCGAREVETYYRVFEDETHASVFPAALSTGLRRLFGN